MINYVDDALYYANNDNFRMDFELLLKKRFNLTLMGEAKWYQGMNDQIIYLSDYILEPKSLYQILKLSDHIKDKWGTAIKKEIVGLFDNDTFNTNERALLADEVIPAKCAFKTKLNAYGGLDKLKAMMILSFCLSFE